MRISDWSSDVCSSDLLRETAAAIGLSRSAQLYRVELPLALRSILAGVQTAAVINVGTATLGDRKSVVSGKSVSVRVDRGGRRIIKKNNTTQNVFQRII